MDWPAAKRLGHRGCLRPSANRHNGRSVAGQASQANSESICGDRGADDFLGSE
jgi:hypothetical protein